MRLACWIVGLTFLASCLRRDGLCGEPPAKPGRADDKAAATLDREQWDVASIRRQIRYGRLTSALAMCDELLEKNPDHRFARLERAKIYRMMGSLDGAGLDLAYLLAKHPDFVYAYDEQAALFLDEVGLPFVYVGPAQHPFIEWLLSEDKRKSEAAQYVLRQLIREKQRQRRADDAVTSAAWALYRFGAAPGYTDYIPQVASFLTDRTELKGFAGPKVRLCDIAVCSLSRLVRARSLEPEFWELPLAERDKAVESWQSWWRDNRDLPLADVERKMVDQAIEQLGAGEGVEQNLRLISRLLGTDFAYAARTSVLKEDPQAIVAEIKTTWRRVRQEDPHKWEGFLSEQAQRYWKIKIQAIQRAKGS